MASLTSDRAFNIQIGAFEVVATANVAFTVPDDLVAVLVEKVRPAVITINSYDRSGSKIGYVVAASDSPAMWRLAADYTCDGTADQSEIQTALNALPAGGGKLTLAPGTYQISAGVTQTANSRVKIEAHGAVWKLAGGVTGLTISQGIVTARGMVVEGLFIDGQSNTGTIGFLLRDTNNAELIDCNAERCATGINLDSNATNKFVEGTLLDNILLRDNDCGIDFTIVSGTGSFAQTVIRGLRCVVGSTSPAMGFRLNANAILQRSQIQGTFWLDSNETAVSLDANIEDTTFTLGIEGAGGATSNVGVIMGSNATNTEQAVINLWFTGTIATQVNNTGNKNFHYWSGGSQIVQSTGNATLGYKRHGDATDRLRFEGLTAGGRIQFGTGAALDVNLYRSAANVLSSDDKIDAASVNLQTKAGAPVDGDITGGAADGDMVIDTTNSKIYVRIGGTWKSAAVA